MFDGLPGTNHNPYGDREPLHVFESESSTSEERPISVPPDHPAPSPDNPPSPVHASDLQERLNKAYEIAEVRTHHLKNVTDAYTETMIEIERLKYSISTHREMLKIPPQVEKEHINEQILSLQWKLSGAISQKNQWLNGIKNAQRRLQEIEAQIQALQEELDNTPADGFYVDQLEPNEKQLEQQLKEIKEELEPCIKYYEIIHSFCEEYVDLMPQCKCIECKPERSLKKIKPDATPEEIENDCVSKQSRKLMMTQQDLELNKQLADSETTAATPTDTQNIKKIFRDRKAMIATFFDEAKGICQCPKCMPKPPLQKSVSQQIGGVCLVYNQFKVKMSEAKRDAMHFRNLISEIQEKLTAMAEQKSELFTYTHQAK